MNTQKIKKSLAVVWLALALSFGTGLVATQLGVDVVNVTHAGGGVSCGGGGGC